MKYAFIKEQRPFHCLRMLCRVMRVSRSGYYAWSKRSESARAQSDRVLLKKIRTVYGDHRGHCGAGKIWGVLKEKGVVCGRHQIGRICRQHGIMARRRRRFIITTRSKYTTWQAPNLLNRNFQVDEPDRVWVADVTFIPTREGFLYLAVLIDLYARRVVGWSMSTHNNSLLLEAALEMALKTRGPNPGLIHHSDQGRTYASEVYRQELTKASVMQSMSRKGDCWDNAVAESFFATLEFELIENQVFESRSVARSAIFEFIEVFYNKRRAHETLGYKTPEQVERAYQMALN